MNLVPFLFLFRLARQGSTENFCSFAKASYFWQGLKIYIPLTLPFSSNFLTLLLCLCFKVGKLSKKKMSKNQILWRFQKCKRKVTPPSPLKFFLRFFRLVPQGWFFRGDGGGTFCLHFWNLHKIWIQESIDLNSVQFGRLCNTGWVTSEKWTKIEIICFFLVWHLDFWGVLFHVLMEQKWIEN